MAIWAVDNPNATVQKAHQEQASLNLNSGIIAENQIGPVFMPQRVNKQIYTNFDKMNYHKHLRLLIQAQMWFMQDGAPPLFSIFARDHLSNAYMSW